MPAFRASACRAAAVPRTRGDGDRFDGSSGIAPRWWRLAIALGLAWLTVARAADLFLVRWLRPDVWVGDLNQHVWWTVRFADPGLFPHDLSAEFFSQPLISPYGYQSIYRVLARYADPQTIAESIPIVLTGCVVWLAFRLGRAAGRSFAAGVVGALFVLGWGEALDVLQSGLQRAFALPILMLGTWALMRRRHELVGVALFLGALMYPPALLNVAALTLVVLAWRWRHERKIPQGWPGLVAGFGLALAIVLVTRAQPWPADLGRQITATEARAIPEFGHHGRLKTFFDDPVDQYFTSKLSGIDYSPWQVAVVAALVAMSALVFRRLIAVEGWVLLATSAALFGLAHLLLFSLYFPNRFVKYSVPTFLVLWLSSLAGTARERWRTRAQMPRASSAAAVMLALLAVVGLGVYTVEVAQRVATEARWPADEEREAVLGFLSTLPKDALIAAHPNDADGIPLRTRRSVLASSETALPFFVGYYGAMAHRLSDELTAYYAPTFAAVDELNRRYGVTVMLISRAQFGPRGLHLFAPFRGEARRLLAAGTRSGFALLHPPADRILFRNRDYCVVRVGPPA